MRLSVVIATLALFFACAGSSPRVEMVAGNAFSPTQQESESGETVTWVNTSDQPHTVTSYARGEDFFSSGGFSSVAEAREDLSEALIAPGESFSFRFADPGVYRYFCIPHEQQGMRGTIEVQS